VTQEATIMSNLSCYPLIERFLGGIVRQRLGIEGYKNGMLTAQLLDEHSKSDLQTLEHALKLGELNCASFKEIFNIGKLPKDRKIADARILDMLAEVRTIEFLTATDCKNTAHLRQKSTSSTVDFITHIGSDIYAVEVTRVGLPISDKKKSNLIAPYSERRRIGNQEINLTWFLITDKDNLPVFKKVVSEAIDAEYPQIKQFCQKQNKSLKGMLAISLGRDYFVTNYARRDLSMFPRQIKETVEMIWQEKKNAYKYLDYVIFLVGKKLDKAFIYPNLVESLN
jgi:hypothetical protein